MTRLPDIVFHPNLAANEDGQEGRWQHFKKSSGPGPGLYWTAKKSTQTGDLYLFYFGQPASSVGGVGVHDGDTRGKEFGFAPVLALRKPIHVDVIRSDARLNAWWKGQPFRGGPKTMLKEPVVGRRLLELILERNGSRKMRRLLEPYLELVQLAAARESIVELPKLSAAEKERVYSDVRRAVRDHRLRRRVLKLWGPQCAACG